MKKILVMGLTVMSIMANTMPAYADTVKIKTKNNIIRKDEIIEVTADVEEKDGQFKISYYDQEAGVYNIYRCDVYKKGVYIPKTVSHISVEDVNKAACEINS